MGMPNFLIIGAAKAGTTALHNYLMQHPEIYMNPGVKESHFFAFENEIVDFQGPGDHEAINQVAIRSIEEYQLLFPKESAGKCKGEASPLYLYSQTAPERIFHYIPSVKLIAILRNPVERAYSSYLYLRSLRREPHGDFANALRDEQRRVAENWEHLWHYKSMGFYHEQLQRYFKWFDRSQIRIYIYDDFERNPGRLIQDMLQFLDVDCTFIPDMSAKPNPSGRPRSTTFQTWLNRPNVLKSLIKPLVPASTRQWVRRANLSRPPLSREIRHTLIAEYREDILLLQDLICCDLSSWLEV